MDLAIEMWLTSGDAPDRSGRSLTPTQPSAPVDLQYSIYERWSFGLATVPAAAAVAPHQVVGQAGRRR
jgi:hypothetical protein